MIPLFASSVMPEPAFALFSFGAEACANISGHYESSGASDGIVILTQEGCSGTSNYGWSYEVSANANTVTIHNGVTGTINEARREISWSNGITYTLKGISAVQEFPPGLLRDEDSAGTADHGYTAESCPPGVEPRSAPVRIFYGLPFRDEFETLAVLLAELCGVIDYFLIVEGTRTFSSSSKPMYLHKEFVRYGSCMDKLIHLKVNPPLDCAESLPLCVERLHGTIVDIAFNRLSSQLRLQGDDLLVLADVDEIVSAPSMQRIKACAYRPPIRFKLRHYIYTLEWELQPSSGYSNLSNCSASGIVGLTRANAEEVVANFGSAGAARSDSWREGPGRLATCIVESTTRSEAADTEPIGWHLSYQGGWRQVLRSFLSMGGRLAKYSNRTILIQMIQDGVVPIELRAGLTAVRQTWPNGQRSLGLPRGLAAGADQVPHTQCWLDSRASDCEAFRILGDDPLGTGTVGLTPAPDAGCWKPSVIQGVDMKIKDWATADTCCLYGGPSACWTEDHSYVSCCAGRVGKGCISFTVSSTCWSLQSDPGSFEKVVELAYGMEPPGSQSHARLLGRLLLAMAIGRNDVAGRPGQGSLGTYAGLDIVEIGVFEGEFSAALLEFLEHVQMPVRQYTLVDRWASSPTGVPGGLVYGYSEDDDDATGNNVHAQRFRRAVSQLSLRWAGILRFLQIDSLTAARWLGHNEERFDLVFVDARHDYDSVWEDLVAWWPLVRIGGLFAGHDYSQSGKPDVYGVKRAVDEFAWALGLDEVLIAPIRNCWLLPKSRDLPSPTRPAWLRG